MDPLVPIGAVLLSAVVTIAAVVPARRAARAGRFVAEPRSDRFHNVPTPLLGGAACLLGLAASLMLWWMLPEGARETQHLPAGLVRAALAGTTGFLVLGLVDDRSSLSPARKAGAQGLILAVVLLLWRPEGRLATLEAAGAAWAAGILLVNAWNYLDHADGVFSSTAAIAAAVLALVWGEAIGGGPALAVLWGLSGAMAGFLLWNHAPARIFLGDGGSLPIGFLLVLAALALVDSGPLEALPAAVGAQCVPLADLLLVTLVRLRARTDPFAGGLDHSGHRLSVALGPGRAVALLLVGATGFGAVGLVLGPLHPRLVALTLPLLSLLLALGLSTFPAPSRAVATAQEVRRPKGSRRRKRSV